ncbi:hypothetical protein [Citrobacter freundii]
MMNPVPWLQMTNMISYQGLVRTFPCIAVIENLWVKYAITAKEIESQRDKASKQLHDFLMELGYE